MVASDVGQMRVWLAAEGRIGVKHGDRQEIGSVGISVDTATEIAVCGCPCEDAWQ